MAGFKKRIFKSAPVQSMIAADAHAFAKSRGDRGTDRGDSSELFRFQARLKNLKGGTVVELGSRRVDGLPSTLRRDWVSDGVKYIGCDYRAGPDVDIVADAENLSAAFDVGSIDAFIACSVFEHIRKPWLAAREISTVLKPGGAVFVQTHQTFPLHAHPHDYWRFSREGIESLFEDGFSEKTSWYEFPATILSAQSAAIAGQPAFLNVLIVAVK